MTLQSLKTLSIALAVALSSCAFSKGAKPPKDIKAYEFHPDNSWCKSEWCQGKTGFVRAQAREVIAPERARGMVGMTPEDFTRLLEACPK